MPARAQREGRKEYGAIETDAAVLEWIRDVHGIGPDAPKAFEGDLMDWCDDATYAVHDVMDLYRSGAIPLVSSRSPAARRHVPSAEAQQFLQGVRQREERDGKVCDRDKSEAAWLELAQLNDLHDPWEPTLEGKAAVQAVTSDMITFFFDGITYDGDAPCEHQGVFFIDLDDDRRELKRRACALLTAARTSTKTRSIYFALPATCRVAHGERCCRASSSAHRRESRGDHRRTSVAEPDPALREPSCRESGSSSPRVDHEMTFYRIRKTTTKELNSIRTSHSRSAGRATD